MRRLVSGEGLCRNAASAPKNFSAFATPLRVSRKTFRRLQHRCKSHEKLSGVCNTVASLTKNFLVFATPLQVPRKTFWRLQHRCKSHEKLSGVCNTVASLTKNFLAFATPLQIGKNTFWPLHRWCKHFQKRFAPRVTSVEALCWLYSYIELELRRSARGFDTQADGLDTIQLFVAHTLTDP